MIGLTISRDGPSGVGEDVVAGVRKGLLEAARAGFQHSQDLVPVDSGELKESGELIVEDEGDTITFAYSADHAILVEGGTEPHPITPDDADVLAFEVDGEQVFATHVDHPGTEPQPFMQPGFERMARELQRRGLTPAIEGELNRP